MSDQDQLERDLEAALARLAGKAVPDARRAPAPPWQERRRAVDARRFGRATPWLVAAVLLVIAGLGVGAGVAFDASAPDRGPVATDPPSPTAVTTVSDGTLGDPTTTPTPTSTPSLDRGSNGGDPDDGVTTSPPGAELPYVVGIGTYGPVRAGMSQAEVLAALGTDAATLTAAYGDTCPVAAPIPGGGRAILDDSPGGTVIGIEPAAGAVDAAGNGLGSTLAQLRATYPGGQLTLGQGWIYSVTDGSGNGLGFSLDTQPYQDVQPTDAAKVTYVYLGNADWGKGYELCSG